MSNQRGRKRIARVGRVFQYGLAGLFVAAAGSFAAADEIELTNGKRYKGLLIEQSATKVTFKVYTARGGKMTRLWPMRQVKDLLIDGKEPVFETPAAKPVLKPETKTETKTETKPESKPQSEPKAVAPGAEGVESTAAKRTPAEIYNLINAAGRTNPPWWDSVEMTYPKKLDLKGTSKAKGWRPDVNVGAYVWGRVNQQPGNWRNGAKVLHHVVEARNGDEKRQNEAINQLAHIYFDLLNDYARAAYWYRKIVRPRRRVPTEAVVNLAACYWQLGSRSLAAALLREYNMDGRRPVPAAIKLWVEMGDFTRAYAMATALSGRPRYGDTGHLAAGNACRYVGRLDEAAEHYRQVLAVTKGSRYLKLHKTRARGSLEAIEVLKMLDMTRLADGTYTGESVGYRGPVGVEVVVADGRIASVKVVKTQEDLTYTGLTAIPAMIVDRQSVRAIEGVTGATTTSDAILNATTKALHKAQ